MKKLITCAIAALILSAIASSSSAARVGVETRSERSASTCLAAIRSRVNSSRVGNPPRAIPGRLRGTASAEIQRAINAGLSEHEAYRIFMGKLRVIPNYYWRRDLARAAAGVVGDAPNECR